MSTAESFWRRVEKRDDGCWIWVGTKNQDGYGRMGNNRRRVLAHRFSYELAIGPIPDGMVTDHLCRVRSCVNPAHLEIVTPRVNTLRGTGFAAVNARKTACPRGHAYSAENTMIYVWRGQKLRYCRECNRAKRKAWGIRQKGLGVLHAS